MIQRIQTLWLLASSASLGLMLFMPMAEIHTGGGEIYLAMSGGLRTGEGELVLSTLPVFILALVCGLMLFTNIFLFKRRRLQIRLCVYGIILAFGLIGLSYYYWVVILRSIEVDGFELELPLILPVISIIFTYLAFRAIRKDEILVRSLDKIR